MLQTIKRLLQRFMSNEFPKIHSLFPQSQDETNVLYWCSSILGLDSATALSCYLDRIDHCKAVSLPKHEFIVVYMTLTLDRKTYKTCCIIDRGPAPEVGQKATTPRNASATSLISSPSTNSIRSRSPSSSEHFIVILGKGCQQLIASCISKTARPFRALALIGNAVQNFAWFERHIMPSNDRKAFRQKLQNLWECHWQVWKYPPSSRGNLARTLRLATWAVDATRLQYRMPTTSYSITGVICPQACCCLVNATCTSHYVITRSLLFMGGKTRQFIASTNVFCVGYLLNRKPSHCQIHL
ncbi:hypothetical protein PILCRDRAFT_496799 [Piloderma croceum F 1598]|uniref:Uncharacterized protein n=1 Tax=Piloderma croceum (strain F 1598) TaxID=765440 RepID=A0A0C3FAA8_PILCF|nr:hypothetical protein PILCRDRAFT_496799 [Piloderma croceum F 1598]